MEEKPALAHEAVDHGAQPVHHHHSHAATSRHGHGHHLLTVEDLSVSFLMYDEEAAAMRAPRGFARRSGTAGALFGRAPAGRWRSSAL